MQLEFIGTRKRFSAVSARIGLRVKCPSVSSGRAVHVEGLVTPRTGVHPGDRISMADGVGPQNVDLIESLVAQPTHVVLAGRVHLAVACQRRVVDEATITHLQHITTTTKTLISTTVKQLHCPFDKPKK